MPHPTDNGNPGIGASSAPGVPDGGAPLALAFLAAVAVAPRWVSAGDLARDVGIDDDTVKLCLAHLVEVGFITFRRDPSAKPAPSDWRDSRFRLDVTQRGKDWIHDRLSPLAALAAFAGAGRVRGRRPVEGRVA